MSRFNYKNINFDPLNLDKSSLVSLRSYLKKILIERTPELVLNIKNFIKQDKSYEVNELSDSLVAVIRKSPAFAMSLNLGYPFSLYIDDITNATPFIVFKKFPVDLDVHLRGEILRNKQRLMLVDILSKLFEKVDIISIGNSSRFKRLASTILSKFSVGKPWMYVDPYNFIGDSIVGLYFVDYLKERFKVKKIIVLSSAYKHLGLFYESYPKEKDTFDRLCKKVNVCIMPDLIDNHFSKTLELLSDIKEADLYLLAISRNMIVHIRDKHCSIFHLDKPDVLLRNQNIEDYMNDCLSPYVSLEKKTFKQILEGKKYKFDNNRFFINPHSSIESKSIPVDFVLELARIIVNKTAGTIYVSEGVKKGNDRRWIRNFRGKLKSRKNNSLLGKIVFLSDDSLTGLGAKLKNLKVSSVLTADTAIAHLVNRIGIPQITYYKDGFWDSESLQSLSAESPLGFCRYDLRQYPAIFSDKTNKHIFLEAMSCGLMRLPKKIFLPESQLANRLKEFNQDLSKQLSKSEPSLSYRTHQKLYRKFLCLKKLCRGTEISWMFYIFDPNKMVEGIISKPEGKTAPLLYCAWKISPLYKFLNDKQFASPNQ